MLLVNVNELTTWNIQKNKDKICQFLSKAAAESAEVTCAVSNKAMEKLEKQLNLWIYKLTPDKK